MRCTFSNPTEAESQAHMLDLLMRVRNYIEEHAENPPKVLIFAADDGTSCEIKCGGSIIGLMNTTLQFIKSNKLDEVAKVAKSVKDEGNFNG